MAYFRPMNLFLTTNLSLGTGQSQIQDLKRPIFVLSVLKDNQEKVEQ